MKQKTCLYTAIIIVISVIIYLIIQIFIPDGTTITPQNTDKQESEIETAKEFVKYIPSSSSSPEKEVKTENNENIDINTVANDNVLKNNDHSGTDNVLQQIPTKQAETSTNETAVSSTTKIKNSKEYFVQKTPTKEKALQQSTNQTTGQLSKNSAVTSSNLSPDIAFSKNKIPRIIKRVKKAKSQEQITHELEVNIAKYFWENVRFPDGYVIEFNFKLDNDGNVAAIGVKSTPQNEYLNRKEVTTYRSYGDSKRAELGNNKVFSARISTVCPKFTLSDYRTNRFKAVYAHNTPDGEFLIYLYNFIKNSGTNHYSNFSGSKYKLVRGVYRNNRLLITVDNK